MQLRPYLTDYDTVLVGPGATDPDATGDLVRALLLDFPPDTTLLIDAAALCVIGDTPEILRRVPGEAVLIPNPHEMGGLLDCDEELVEGDAESALVDALGKFACAIALRGADTWVSAPGHPMYVERTGRAALATAGSGDVVAGAVAGLLARRCGAGARAGVGRPCARHGGAGARRHGRGSRVDRA